MAEAKTAEEKEAEKAKVPEFIKPESAAVARQFQAALPIMYIKYKGIFDLSGLYRMCASWFKGRKFELHERMYKAKPPELELWWEAVRRSNAYFMDNVEFRMHILDLEDIEVIKDGKKRKLAKGRMKIKLTCTIIADYADVYGERKWRTAFERKLYVFMNKYVLRQDIDLDQEDRLYYELYQLDADIKKFLDMTAQGNAY